MIVRFWILAVARAPPWPSASSTPTSSSRPASALVTGPGSVTRGAASWASVMRAAQAPSPQHQPWPPGSEVVARRASAPGRRRRPSGPRRHAASTLVAGAHGRRARARLGGGRRRRRASAPGVPVAPPRVRRRAEAPACPFVGEVELASRWPRPPARRRHRHQRQDHGHQLVADMLQASGHRDRSPPATSALPLVSTPSATDARRGRGRGLVVPAGLRRRLPPDVSPCGSTWRPTTSTGTATSTPTSRPRPASGPTRARATSPSSTPTTRWSWPRPPPRPAASSPSGSSPTGARLAPSARRPARPLRGPTVPSSRSPTCPRPAPRPHQRPRRRRRRPGRRRHGRGRAPRAAGFARLPHRLTLVGDAGGVPVVRRLQGHQPPRRRRRGAGVRLGGPHRRRAQQGPRPRRPGRGRPTGPRRSSPSARRRPRWSPRSTGSRPVGSAASMNEAVTARAPTRPSPGDVVAAVAGLRLASTGTGPTPSGATTSPRAVTPCWRRTDPDGHSSADCSRPRTRRPRRRRASPGAPAAATGRRLGLGAARRSSSPCCALIGLMMVLSASSVEALRSYGGAWIFFQRQLIWVGIGTLALVGHRPASTTATGAAGRSPLLVVSVVLLVLVLVPGRRHPASAARPAGWAAGCFRSSRRSSPSWPCCSSPPPAGPAGPTGWATVPADAPPGAASSAAWSLALVLLQPDMGTAMLMLLIVFVLLFVAGMPSCPHGRPRCRHRGRGVVVAMGGGVPVGPHVVVP